MNVLDLKNHLQCEIFVPAGLENNLKKEIAGITSLDESKLNHISFLNQPKFEKYLENNSSLAIILSEKKEDLKIVQLIHKNVYLAYSQAAQLLWKKRIPSPAIHPSAFIHPTAKIEEDVIIYANVFVGENARIGRGTELRANVVVEYDCIIGKNVLIHAGTVIGADGFGFVPTKNGISKIPQLGIVRIDDDVEIGAGSTIDRAALGETVVGAGTKIDSSVHLGHNVKVGKNCLICGAVSVGGSVDIGDNVTLGGQVGIANGLKIASNIRVGGRAGITKDLVEEGDYMGFPAQKASDWRKEKVYIRKIKDMGEKLREIDIRTRSNT